MGGAIDDAVQHRLLLRCDLLRAHGGADHAVGEPEGEEVQCDREHAEDDQAERAANRVADDHHQAGHEDQEEDRSDAVGAHGEPFSCFGRG